MNRINLILAGLLIWASLYGQELEIKNVLIPYEKQVNDYRKSLNTKAQSLLYGEIYSSKIFAFEMKSPYVIVTVEEEKIKDLKIMEENIDEQTIDQVKMVIFKYDKLYVRSSYHFSGTNTYEETKPKSKQNKYAGTKSSYGAILIYFDMNKKECVGYDEIKGEPLPYSTDDLGDLFIDMDEIIEKIETRILPLYFAYQEANPKRLDGTWSGKVERDINYNMLHYNFEGNKLKFEWQITKKRSMIYEGSIMYKENRIIFTPEKVIFNGKERKKGLYIHEDDHPVFYYTLTDNELNIHASYYFNAPTIGRFPKKETD